MKYNNVHKFTIAKENNNNLKSIFMIINNVYLEKTFLLAPRRSFKFPIADKNFGQAWYST